MNTPRGIEREFDAIIQARARQFRHDLKSVEEELEKQNCLFGGKLLPFFLKPYFLSQAQTGDLRRMSISLMAILEKITQLYFEDKSLRPVFHLGRDAEKLMVIDPGYKRNVVIARPDCFPVRGGFRIVEFNCDSPAGAGLSDREEEIFQRSPALMILETKYRFLKPNRLHHLLDALLACYREYGGAKKFPNIAIVDWPWMKTQQEFQITRDFFKEKGYRSAVADPRALKLKGGKLMVDDFEVDLIYRRAIFRELLEHASDVQDFFKAYRQGRVCVVNPLRSRLASSKVILSIVTHPAFDSLFTQEERDEKARAVPWTRRVMDSEIEYKGKKVSMDKFIMKNREVLVLKPSDSYGGRGVLVGRETPAKVWERAVKESLAHPGSWVVQEYVPIPEISVPVLKGRKLAFEKKKLNLNPYVFNGKFAGAIVRLSDKSVINVSAGGGLIPAIQYADRRS